MSTTTKLPTLYVPEDSLALPDTDQWRFRFEIKSESSNRIYVVAQHRHKKHWGCSCPGWKRFRKCKHLQAMGIPGHERPYEVNVIHE